MHLGSLGTHLKALHDEKSVGGIRQEGHSGSLGILLEAIYGEDVEEAKHI